MSLYRTIRASRSAIRSLISASRSYSQSRSISSIASLRSSFSLVRSSASLAQQCKRSFSSVPNEGTQFHIAPEFANGLKSFAASLNKGDFASCDSILSGLHVRALERVNGLKQAGATSSNHDLLSVFFDGLRVYTAYLDLHRALIASAQEQMMKIHDKIHHGAECKGDEDAAHSHQELHDFQDKAQNDQQMFLGKIHARWSALRAHLGIAPATQPSLFDFPPVSAFLASMAQESLKTGNEVLALDIAEKELMVGDEASSPASKSVNEHSLRLARGHAIAGDSKFRPPEPKLVQRQCGHDHGDGHHGSHSHDEWDYSELAKYDWTQSRSHWMRAIELLQPSIEATNQSSGVNPEVLFESKSLLGRLHETLSQAYYATQSESDSISHLQSAYSIVKMLKSPREDQSLELFHKLFAYLCKSERYEEAFRVLEDRYEAVNKIDGKSQEGQENEKDQNVTNKAVSNVEISENGQKSLLEVADLAFDLRWYSAAVPLYEELIASLDSFIASLSAAELTRNRSIPEQSLEFLKAEFTGRIGICYLRGKQFDQARDHLMTSVVAKEKLVGKSSQELAVELHQLGICLTALKEFKAAEALYTRAIPLVEKKFSGSPQLANVYLNYSELWTAQQQWKKAEEIIRKALAVKESLYGPHSSQATIETHALGLNLIQQRRHQESIDLYMEYLHKAIERLGESNSALIFLHQWCGNAYCEAEQWKSGLEHLKRAVELAETAELNHEIQPNITKVIKDRYEQGKKMWEQIQKDKEVKLK